MIFSDAIFLFLFLPLTLFVYYCLKNINRRNIWLLIMSLLFYAWGEPVYVFLMLISIVANYFFACLLPEHKNEKGRKIVTYACIFNLGILIIFKYLSWLMKISGFDFLVNSDGMAILKLPIGISFYTFQSLSYVIDVYRGKSKAQKNFLNVGLYIALFPQLVAGPIVRYGSIERQLVEREHNFSKFSDGVWRFCVGLAKKVLIADQVANVANLAWDNVGNNLSAALAWLGMLAYMIQIYFDFSGYSDMAIGLGKMFGFEFSENFNYPYISKSISEYWRRWHISLGEWFRDYLYYPLSLGFAVKFRKKIAKFFSPKNSLIVSNAAVLFIVWLATGIWHGANFTFIAWGLLQFIFILYEQLRPARPKTKFSDFAAFLKTFFIVMIVKVVSRCESIDQTFEFYKSLLCLNNNALIDNLARYWWGQYKISIFLGFIFMFPVAEKLDSILRDYKSWEIFKTAVMIFIFVMSASYVVGGGYNPFVYFDF